MQCIALDVILDGMKKYNLTLSDRYKWVFIIVL